MDQSTAPIQTPPPRDLRALIAASGLTQAQVARQLGIKPQQLQEWLSGRRPVPLRHCPSLEQIGLARCEDLRADVDWQRDPTGALIAYRVRVAPATTQEAA